MGKWYHTVALENTVAVATSEVALFEDKPMQEAEQLLVLVSDAAAANAATLKLYGSLDGTSYDQMYFFDLKDNIHDGSAAANTQASVVGPGTIHVWTDKVMPFMKLTAQRSSGSGNITATVKLMRSM